MTKKVKRAARRVGPDLSHKLLRPGHRLIAPHKKITYLIVKVEKGRILAKIRRGGRGRFSSVLHEVVPAEVMNFRIEE